MEFSKYKLSPICLPEDGYSSIESFVGFGVTVQGWSGEAEKLSEIDVVAKYKKVLLFK